MFDHRIAETYLDVGLAKLFDRWFPNLETASKSILNALIIYGHTAASGAKLAEVYAAMSLVFNELKKFDEAVKLARKALNLYEQLPQKNFKNFFKLAHVHDILGRSLMHAQHYDEALDHLQTVASIFEQLSPHGHLDVALAYREIAELHKVVGNFDAALHFLAKALRLQEKLRPQNVAEFGRTHSSLAHLYRLMGKRTGDISYTQKSSDIYQTAIKIYNVDILKSQLTLLEAAKENDNAEEIIRRYCGAADSCRILKRYAEAQRYIRSALEKITRETDSWLVYMTYFTASQIFTEEENFNLALNYAHKSLTVYQDRCPNDEDSFLKTQLRNIENIRNAIRLKNLRQNPNANS